MVANVTGTNLKIAFDRTLLQRRAYYCGLNDEYRRCRTWLNSYNKLPAQSNTTNILVPKKMLTVSRIFESIN
ncbi:hypothetical protein M378DRAFT_368080 [Amanita muscaria Koide BX008]|uniref:Uncharacterized protein n=1 Tax=Amanita muscaria (strain Koide BX008) TaxID=946122 RepID=A0A0C2XCH2_AMAMK|nr:hypothetical protein M378DRAFT_368080 [Amanita muscaria Koide BX008]